MIGKVRQAGQGHRGRQPGSLKKKSKTQANVSRMGKTKQKHEDGFFRDCTGCVI